MTSTTSADKYQHLIARLGSVPHFQGLPEAAIREIVLSGQICSFPAGALIFTQDEPSAGMHVLISGKVHLCRLGPQGQQTTMIVIQPVIMFNEVSVLDGGPNPVTAIAVQDCHLWRVSHPTYQGLLIKYPLVGLSLLRILATRNRLMIEHFEDLSFRTVPARLAKLLLDLSAYGRQPVDRREHSIRDLASRIATVPEAISRSLNSYKRDGLITCSRTLITVTQPAELASLAQIGPLLLREL